MTRLTKKSVSVSDALATRFSCRAFLDTPIDERLLRAIIAMATRAPSGGNLQPWHIHVVGGTKLQELVAITGEKSAKNPAGEGAEYHIYPPDLKDPYNARRRDIGERMYDLLGIARDDKAGRFAQLARNFNFFGAPCALFFSIDKTMQEGQWSDLGMLIQSICLLVREHGLHSCPQEAWAIWAPTVKQFLSIPDTSTFFCAMAIGYADPDAPINQLESPRADMEEIVQFIGF